MDEGPESGGGVICTGDSYGRVRLQNFPSMPNSSLLEWRGHSGPIIKLAFNADETHLLSIGYNDRCIFQWTLSEDDRDPEDADQIEFEAPDDLVTEMRDGADFDCTLSRETAVDSVAERALIAELEVDGMKKSTEFKPTAEEAVMAAVTDCMPFAKDPWHASLTPPSNPRQPLPSPLRSNLTLQRIFGYSCCNARNNAKYSPSGAVIYPAGGALVHLNVNSGTQSFGTAHAGREIVALAISCDGTMCATSDVSSEPFIALWSADNVSRGPLRLISEPHQRAVTLLAFDDASGENLASVGADENHSLAIHDVNSGHLLFLSMTTKLKPLHIVFGHQGGELAMVGVKHVLFFAFASGHPAGRHAASSFARFGRQGMLQAFLCAAYLPSGKTVVGTADGHLYVLGAETRELEKSVKAHDMSVCAIDAPWSLRSTNDTRDAIMTTTAIVSGSRDGNVKLWSAELECIAEFDNLGAGPIKAVCASVDGSKILVGSQGAAQLREFRSSDGMPIGPPIAGGGAAAGEFWGLAAHPTEQRVAVASDDGALILWNIDQPSTKARAYATQLPGPCRSLAYSPDGTIIAAALGGIHSGSAHLSWARARRDITSNEPSNQRMASNETIDGMIHLIRAECGTLIYQFSEAREWHRDLKFSRNGKLLVCGSNDGSIYVYKADNQGHFSHSFSAAFSERAAIHSLDISKENQYVQSANEARALTYGDLTTGVAIPDPAMLKDTEWTTWSSVLGWPTVAVHTAYASPAAGGYEVETKANDYPRNALNLTCVARSHSEHILATGDQHGVIRLIRYPAGNPSISAVRPAVAHVGPVRRIVWSSGDQHLVTVGQHDRLVCVWRYESETAGNEAKDDDLYATCVNDDALEADGGGSQRAAVERATKLREKYLAQVRQMRIDSGADETMFDVPVWLSSLVPPSNLEQDDPSPPEISLTLMGAHGQRSDECRGGVAYNANGNVVRACGALGVIYDSQTRTQHFHCHHPNGGALRLRDAEQVNVSTLADVSAIAVTPDGHYAASGDQVRHIRLIEVLTNAL